MAKTTKPTQVEIKAWKEKYGEIYALPVEDKTGYLRKPNMTDYKRAFAQYANGEIAFQEEMMKILRIGGDEEVFSDDAYFFPARKKMADFLAYPDAEIKELGSTQSEIVIEGHRCVVRKITRDDLKLAGLANPGAKAFVTQEKLFERIVKEKDAAYDNRNDASIRFPLYQAIEQLQNQKVAQLKKL